ncbi:hypothetical protein FO519_007735 [Halicephalobus sp. NKZ332]|nr:hypothetical protein FO519_007735 [Halicephalobus sp. NKZ332]
MRIVQGFELFLIAISLASGSVVLMIFYKTPLLHRNLLGLMAMVGIEFFIVMISRIVMLSLSFDNEDYIADPEIVVKNGPYFPIEVVRCFSCGCMVIAVFCAVLERAAATIYLGTYEKNHSYNLLIYFAFLQFAGSAFFSYFFFKGAINWIFIVAFGAIISIVTLIIFLVTYYINKKKHNLSVQNKVKYTLSERYQLSENLRAFTIMKKTVLYLGIGNIAIITTVFVINFLHQKFSMLIFRASFNITVILYSVLIPIVFVTSVEIWRLKYIKFFIGVKNRIFCKRRSIEDLSIRKLQHLRSSTGQQLGFDIHQERDIFFEALKKSWN